MDSQRCPRGEKWLRSNISPSPRRIINSSHTEISNGASGFAGGCSVSQLGVTSETPKLCPERKNSPKFFEFTARCDVYPEKYNKNNWAKSLKVMMSQKKPTKQFLQFAFETFPTAFLGLWDH